MFSKKFISVDIGSKNIKIVEGRYENKKVIVTRGVTVETPENCYSDGNLNNLITMKGFIKSVIKDNKFKGKDIIFTTKSSSIITRIIEIPWVKPKEAEAAIRFEIEQYFPIEFEEFIIKYKLLEEYQKDEARIMRIGVAVYPKAMAKMYWDLAKELNLVPAALDLNTNAIQKLIATKWNLVVNDKEFYTKNSTIALIDMGHDHLELSILSNGITEFTRIIPGGGSYLDANIASQMSLNKAHAEKVKKILCDFQYYIRDDDSYHNEIEVVNKCIRVEVNRWLGEINRMLEYFINRNRESQKQIQKIFIYGGSSNLNGIIEYMQNSLGIEVEQLNSISNIKKEAKDCEIDNIMYLNAIGSLVRLK